MKESEMLVLSSSHHYFYDAEEMKNVKVVTSLKELNKISDLKGFLKTLSSTLQPNTFFLGHFTSNDSASSFIQDTLNPGRADIKISEDIDNGIRSRFTILNKIYNILDARSFSSLSNKTVELYLRNYGFKLVDMTATKMTTCFCAQRLPSFAS
jgi:hypothetical protein